MRCLLTFVLFTVLIFALEASETLAQSGSRSSGGGGARRSSGGSTRSSGGGGASRSRGGGVGGSTRRASVSPAERARQAQLAREQYDAQVAQAQEQSKAQYLQTLNQLADSQYSSQNATQNRKAFQEAKRDFKALQNEDVLPDQLGGLQVPYRLTTRELNRRRGTITWPKPLQGSDFETLVGSVDGAIVENQLTDAESASMFLQDLSALDKLLNMAAVDGTISIKDFAKSRRFITGLANEIRATGLANSPPRQSDPLE